MKGNFMSLSIKKSTNSKILTEKVFEVKLEKKLKKALKPYVTKKYLSNEFLKYNSAIANDFLQAKNERNMLLKEIKSLQQQRTTDMSLLMGELKTIREEIATFGYRQSKHSKKIEQLDNHETRITRVETHLGFQAHLG